MRQMFGDVLENVRPQNASDTDLVRIYVHHPELSVPITISPRQWSELNANVIMDKIEYVLSSKSELSIESGFEIHVGSINIPVASGTSKIKIVSGPFSCLLKKRSLITIQNDDNLCLARALVVGIAKQEKDERYHLIRNSKSPMQRKLAEIVHGQTGLPFNLPVSLKDIPLFEHVTQRQVVVFSATSANKPIYVGTPRDKRIYLYHTITARGGHFDTIGSITGCLGVAYFCEKCFIGYQVKSKHK